MPFSQMRPSLLETESLLCIIPMCGPPLTHMRRISMLSRSGYQLMYEHVLLMIILLAHFDSTVIQNLSERDIAEIT